MLISEEVETVWSGRMKNYYQDKGYSFTKLNDKLMVKVKDLPEGSHVFVKVQCDNEDCNKILDTSWQTYLDHKHNDDKYYCNKCVKKLYTVVNSRKTRLLNGLSFEEWCVQNNKLDILNRWDYDLNDCKPSGISHGVKNKYYFKCPNGLHESELKSINDFTSGHDGIMNCKKCNSFAQYLINNYGNNALDLYWDWEKNIINPWNIDKNSTNRVWIKCQEKDYHGSSKILINSFTAMGVRCPYCGKKKVHIFDSLGYLYPEVLNLWSDKNKKSPYKYKPYSSEEVYWKCPEGKHEDYKRNITSSNSVSFRCPKCVQEQDESLIQEMTRLYINSLGHEILHENNCTLHPKNIVKHKAIKRIFNLRYDNEIIINDKHLIIEVNGQQHYEINSWHKKLAEKYNTTPEYELEYQKAKDKYKKDYALYNDYLFLELPYWEFNKEDTYKNLIDNAIKDLKEVS